MVPNQTKNEPIVFKGEPKLPFFQSFISGSIAGLFSRTFTSPLNVLKTVSQVGTEEGTHGRLFSSVKSIYAKDGIKGFWKGNATACIRLIPHTGIQFAVYNELKGSYKRYSFIENLYYCTFAGAMAGVIATVATHPLDVVKTLYTVDKADKKVSFYKGYNDIFTQIYRNEGFLAFYKGLLPSVLGVALYSGFLFMAYELINSIWGKPPWEITPNEHFISGCIAALFAQTFSFPFDTIRKKMQVRSAITPSYMNPDVEFSGMIDAFRATIRKKGMIGLWSGNTANLLKLVPLAGSTFAIYGALSRYFILRNQFGEDRK